MMNLALKYTDGTKGMNFHAVCEKSSFINVSAETTPHHFVEVSPTLKRFE